jgi:hypothetical protein
VRATLDHTSGIRHLAGPIAWLRPWALVANRG